MWFGRCECVCMCVEGCVCGIDDLDDSDEYYKNDDDDDVISMIPGPIDPNYDKLYILKRRIDRELFIK